MNRQPVRVTAALLAAAALVGVTAPLAAADGNDPGARHGSHGGGSPARERLDLLVGADGVPGALAYEGHRTVRAGTAELGSGRPMVGAEGRVRMGSNTKAFTAAAVMRLVVDGRLRVDDRAGRYVPQLADSPITIRQLLRQRSGLADYAGLVDWEKPLSDEGYLGLVLREDVQFEPGTEWGYSNTNYLVLGMVITRASGTDYRTYIEHTILRPLRLDSTYWPGPGELTPRGPHARNYGVHPLHPEQGLTDVTELPAYEFFGASGGLVTTPKDLNAFWDGLFGGKLLPRWALRRMTHDTTDVGGRDVYPEGSRYGYGVASIPLSCGGTYWGHGGDLPGVSVGGGRATDGRGTVTVYTTTVAAQSARLAHLQGAVDAALCDGR
ncbi:serine hydrolase domain-containing protein [Streptomyces buecherae]|uniref:serine hydrolase domain-containing protein n=1 Tax=Streptomyces buecherae TaxID=2763006 RepID=UPI003407A6AD